MFTTTPPPHRTGDTTTNLKNDLLQLFEDVIDCTAPETRANLRFISTNDENVRDSAEYAQIWCSLATTLFEAHESKIEINLPFELPFFVIADHKTHIYWYEVIYRSLRIIKAIWNEKVRKIASPSMILLDAYTSHLPDWSAIHLECTAILGVQRIVVSILETFMKGYADEDMGYNAEDALKDAELCITMSKFASAIIHAGDSQTDNSASLKAAEWFKAAGDSCRNISKSASVILKPHSDRFTAVCLSDYHCQVTSQYSRSLAFLQHYAPHETNRARIAESKRKASAMPQASFVTREECEKEISELNLNIATHTGVNPLELFPFELKHQST